MLDDEGFTRKSTRMAAIEAAKRIKKNADANKSRSHDEKEEYQFYEDTSYRPLVVAVTDNGCDNNTQRRRGQKRKMSIKVFDSTNPPSKAQTMPDLSKKISKFVEVSLSEYESMSKRRRGRPPKSQYAKRTFTPNRSIRYKKSELKHEEEVDYAINLRRESYNNSRAKNEPILATVFCSPKQLQLVNGGMSYRESLMLFSKDLGPIARKVAFRKLLGEGENYEARHRLPLPDTHPHPCFVDMGSTNSSVRNTKTYQVDQPLTSYGASNTYANYIADYKGKNIMVDDDGKNNGSKWNIDNLGEMLLGKMKGGVKICSKGNGSSENQEFGHGQFGMINEIGSFLLKNNGNLQQNIDMMVDEKEDVWINNASEAAQRNGKYDSCVYPSSYDHGGVNLIRPPLDQYHRLPPPPENEMKNRVVSDGFCLQEELQLALANYMQMEDQESNVWFQDSSLLFGQDFGVEMGNYGI